jgi:hypothetical protein
MYSDPTKKYYYCHTCSQIAKDVHIHAQSGHQLIESQVIINNISLSVKFRYYTLLMFYKDDSELYNKLTPLFTKCTEYITKEDFFRIVRQALDDLSLLTALHRLEMLCYGIIELIQKEEDFKKEEAEKKLKDSEKKQRYLESHRKAVIRHREKIREEKKKKLEALKDEVRQDVNRNYNGKRFLKLVNNLFPSKRSSFK